METSFDRVRLTTKENIAILALNHPDSMNALSPNMATGLMAALDHVVANGFRAIVLTGEAPAFCSGANLVEAVQEAIWPPDTGRYLDEYYHPLLLRIRDLPVPILTAVNGAAAGIGMSLALMGDLVVATHSAFFTQGFIHIGLVPDGGSTWLLPRLIGLARARELSLLGERLSADTALAWGLINRVCPDKALRNEAIALAERLANGPSFALAATRRLYWESPQNGFEAQLAREREAQREAGLTEDFREGVCAFIEKRSTRFRR